ncbi:MAG TPA: heme-binding domain-containing protein [Acidobacteriaceae bacterium]|nr:heme-binding domain-containing protein [Acidobacteriaceae bacterium]
MKRLRWLIGSVAAALGASFLLAAVHPFGSHALAIMPPSAQRTAGIPRDVEAILSEKCADCHAGPRRVPLYGHFAPASWLMERDVVRARQAMDLSRWQSYSPDEQEALRSKIVFESRKRSMPPPQYVAMHWTARLSDAEIRTIVRWAANRTAAAPGDQSVVPGDAHRGQLTFEKRCTGCHALTHGREGPPLGGVYGRTSGSIPGFDYSSALRSAHVVWNDATLDRWLADPDAFIPGNNMEFHVASPQERADLIRFLQQQP